MPTDANSRPTTPSASPGRLARVAVVLVGVVASLAVGGWAWAQVDASALKTGIGRELGLDEHLQDDQEFVIPLAKLIEHGRKVFAANFR